MPAISASSLGLVLILSLFTSCEWKVPQGKEGLSDTSTADTPSVEYQTDTLIKKTDSVLSIEPPVDSTSSPKLSTPDFIDTKGVHPDQVIDFAETLVGIPYVYGSTDPKIGFDCSGFITYAFNNFQIKVPRSSIQFTNVGKTVPVDQAKRGDIILFTDPDFSNTTSLQVGHMGLITSNENGSLNFIHSTSGKAMSVTITPFNEGYKKRFVRIGRIFPQNDN